MHGLDDLFLFVEVARRSSFVRASEALDIPTSTVSRRIARHEKVLGVPLFVRTTRRVELTEAGRLYLSRCEQILEAARAARDEVQDALRTPRGLLRVSMSPDFGATFLAPVIADFHRLYPEIVLQLDLTPRRVDLAAEGFDLAVRIGEPEEPLLIARKLVLARRGLVATRDFLARHPALRKPADLEAVPCLTVGHHEHQRRWVLTCGPETVSVRVGGSVTANTPGMVLQLALEGLGIAVTDAAMASLHLRAGRLVRVLPDWEITPMPIYTVTASKVESTRVRLFLDHLHKRLKGFASRQQDGGE